MQRMGRNGNMIQCNECRCSTRRSILYSLTYLLYYLNYGHPGADVYQQVRKDVWISRLKAEF